MTMTQPPSLVSPRSTRSRLPSNRDRAGGDNDDEAEGYQGRPRAAMLVHLSSRPSQRHLVRCLGASAHRSSRSPREDINFPDADGRTLEVFIKQQEKEARVMQPAIMTIWRERRPLKLKYARHLFGCIFDNTARRMDLYLA